MGYYSASKYRGDWYGSKGDYYRPRRGDPGFLDFLGQVGQTVASAFLPAAAPAAASLGLGGAMGAFAGKLLSPGAPIQSPAPQALTPAWSATAPGSGSTAAMIPTTPASFFGSIGGSRGIVVKTGGGGSSSSSAASSSGGRSYRRMNALNPKALRRALRRAEGFKAYATKVLKLVGEKRHVDGFKKCAKKKRAFGR